jgi:hypothetical protein
MEYLFSSQSQGTESAVTAAKTDQKGEAEDGNLKAANAESDAATTPKKDSEHTARSDEHTGADAA